MNSKAIDHIKNKISLLKSYLKNFVKMDSRNLQLILNVILILVINLAAAAFSFKVDLTSKHSYSLSGRSRETVSALDEKLKIKVLFSKDIPAEHAAVFRYLKDMLEEYSFYGNRNFSYEIIDDEESLKEQAETYGIKQVSGREFSNDRSNPRKVYMGLVIQHADLIEKIDALTSTVGVEYEITSRIEKMTGKIDRLLKLEKPFMLTLYLDERVKDLPIEGIGKLEDLLKSVVARSNLRNYDKIRFQVIDPSKGEDRGLDKIYGISKLKWGAMKSRSGKPISGGEGYFGLVMEGNGRFVKIDLEVAPTIMKTNIIIGLQNLEDTINNDVGDLLSSSLKVGYVKGHGIPDITDKKTPEGAGLFSEILSDMYQLREIDLKSESIPADIRVLIINGPVDLFTDAEKYRIDQFLMEGKSVLLFVNSFMEADSGDPSGEPLILPVSSGLEEMTAHYGIKVNKDIVLDKYCSQVNWGDRLLDYPLIPLIKKAGLNSGSVITKYLNSSLFVKTSSLEIDEKIKDKGVTASVLVSTSPDSWLMKGKMNLNPFFMAPPSGVEMKSYPVAALVSGKFDSFFKDRDIPVEILSADKKNILSTVHKLNSTVTSGRSELIVVGTSELNSSGFINSARRILSSGNSAEVYSNDIMIHSMVDYLAGNSYVPEMKSKSLDFNPLIKTGDQTRFLLKIINMGLVPFFVIITGLVVWRRRIARKKFIETEFSGSGRE